MIRIFAHTLAIGLLTLLTQIGGLAYVLALGILKAGRQKRRFTAWLSPVIFLICYAGVSFGGAVLAPHFGRVTLPCIPTGETALSVRSLYCALNRHYVRPELRDLALQLSSHVDNKFPGTSTVVLDANFPFWDGFPLLPHRSHDDGLKLDLAFYYQAPDGTYLPGKTKSPLGYWVFEEPAAGSALPCAHRNDRFTLRWSVPWLRPFARGYELEEDRTKAALEWLTSTGKQAGVSRIFLEPHLVRSLGVHSDIVRFQGCRAARHDDHIHIEIRP